MLRIVPGKAYPLFGALKTKLIEQATAVTLPPHTLMSRAGDSVARLARSLCPHAETIWIACGPGNNGGDGLEAARVLKRYGIDSVVTVAQGSAALPDDAKRSLEGAKNEGIRFSDHPPSNLNERDLCIDAMLGIGATRAPAGLMAQWLRHMTASSAAILSVDVPSGLDPDTGLMLPETREFTGGFFANQLRQTQRRHTLSLLTLKPGLFIGPGRDAAGSVWFDDLAVTATLPADAFLNPEPVLSARAHDSHKGTYGTVAVLGGQNVHYRGLGMTGAALLAAKAALCGGAGRVLVALLDEKPMIVDMTQPELMFRDASAVDWSGVITVCGCGGGDEVTRWLPRLFEETPKLVLDADSLNAMAADPSLQTLVAKRSNRKSYETVVTPHPLEAARLLKCTTAEIQADRLGASRCLADRLQCTVVLKGSGTVVASPHRETMINPTGNGRLGSAGTGDVLAGLIGAKLAGGLDGYDAACSAVYLHGAAADRWPQSEPLTAQSLALAMC